MCAPKIIIFTRNIQKFIEINKDYQNNTIYSESQLKKINNTDDVILTFEYIDKKEKLLLPLFFKSLIDNISNNNMEKYTSSLYNEYSKNKNVKNLLG